MLVQLIGDYSYHAREAKTTHIYFCQRMGSHVVLMPGHDSAGKEYQIELCCTQLQYLDPLRGRTFAMP